MMNQGNYNTNGNWQLVASNVTVFKSQQIGVPRDNAPAYLAFVRTGTAAPNTTYGFYIDQTLTFTGGWDIYIKTTGIYDVTIVWSS